MLSKKQADILFQTYNILFNEYGTVPCPLYYQSKFQLMVSVILSAQCTDKAVNKVTPILFNKYPNPEKLSQANINDIENIIKPLGLYHAKSKNIIAAAKFLITNFNSKVPSTIEKLIKLPGVGRKTANVIISHAFNKPGFAVDTHVKRLLNRIGILETDNPERIEFEVKANLPENKLSNFSLLLITHGRQCCHARKPKCRNCVINKICLWKEKVVYISSGI